jgi:hypothetical protein
MPDTRLSRVVFPEPLGPIAAALVPDGIRNSGIMRENPPSVYSKRTSRSSIIGTAGASGSIGASGAIGASGSTFGELASPELAVHHEAGAQDLERLVALLHALDDHLLVL